MDSFSLKQVFFFGVVPLIAVLIYLKPGILVSLRQKWLVRLQSQSHGHSHDNKGQQGHGHQVPFHDNDETPNPKIALFKSLTTKTNSKVPALKDSNSGIRILEIGVGSGANFQYFPSKCTFIAVDPNPQFDSLVKDNLAKYPGIKMERNLLCGAEDIDEVEAKSVDVVVGTGVFCNINDVHKAFEQIIRVLVPGGSFYFMDHHPREEHTFGRYFYDFLSWSGISKLIFNATLNRNVNEEIEKVGFSVMKKEIVNFKGHHLVVGVATK